MYWRLLFYQNHETNKPKLKISFQLWQFRLMTVNKYTKSLVYLSRYIRVFQPYRGSNRFLEYHFFFLALRITIFLKSKIINEKCFLEIKKTHYKCGSPVVSRGKCLNTALQPCCLKTFASVVIELSFLTEETPVDLIAHPSCIQAKSASWHYEKERGPDHE